MSAKTVTTQDLDALLADHDRLAEYFMDRALRNGTTVALFKAYTEHVACRHRNAVPVEDLLGERVATLCPDCDQQLPAEWKTSALPPFEPDPTLTRRFKQ